MHKLIVLHERGGAAIHDAYDELMHRDEEAKCIAAFIRDRLTLVASGAEVAPEPLVALPNWADIDAVLDALHKQRDFYEDQHTTITRDPRSG